MADITPEVSVIITSYNLEGYIERAISSALNQQGVTLEVIVVDDCSTDNTWSVICKNTDPRVKYHKLKANGGPSVARNTAIAMATGKWVAILDGDDIFLPNRLVRCLALSKARHADIIVDNILVYREVDQKQSLMFPEEIFSGIKQLDLATFILEKVSGTNYVLGYLKPLFLRSFLHKHLITYNTNLKIGEDYIFLAEALANGAVCVVEPTAGYQYTVRIGSISYRLSLDDIERILTADTQLASKYKLNKACKRAQNKRKHNFKKEYYFLMQVNALKSRNIKEFFKIVREYPPATILLSRLLRTFTARLLTSKKNKIILSGNI